MTVSDDRSSVSGVVSIHTPTQGVTLVLILVKLLLLSFNPHTHAGCDYTGTRYFSVFIVSIHTPTQGVTMLIMCVYLYD